MLSVVCCGLQAVCWGFYMFVTSEELLWKDASSLWFLPLLHLSYSFSHRPLPSARQDKTCGDCLEVKREYYRNCSVLDCMAQCSQSTAHLYEQFWHVNRLGLSHWDPYAVRKGSCLELYYCNMVEWFWWDSSLFSTTNCFDLVIWPVKIIRKMTYNVLSGMLSLYNTIISLPHLPLFLKHLVCVHYRSGATGGSWMGHACTYENIG